MKKLFILLAFLFLLPLPVFATEVAEKNFDYTCTVCYEPLPVDRVECETFMAPALEAVQNMVIAATESRTGLDKVTVDCSFPDRTVKGYSGYIAEIKFKK